MASEPTERRLIEIEESLRRLRARARFLLVWRWVALIVGITLLAALAGALVDYALRFPMPARLLGWIIAFSLVGFTCWRHVRPALRFRPALVDIALWLEARDPRLRGWLASALELGRAPDASTTETALAWIRQVRSRAASSWAASTAHGTLRSGPAAGGAAIFAVALVLCLAPALVRADLWAIGAQRILTPWTGAQWPRRTAVADMTGVDAHPLGAALPLRAALTRTNRDVEDTDVFVRYRAINAGAEASTRRELLTPQGDLVPVEGLGERPLFERLIEPVGEFIEYRFETDDDRTAWRRIRLVDPPAVVAASARITAPDYARQDDTALEIDMGGGVDERAVAPASLTGSRVELELTLNKPARIVGAPTLADLLRATGGAAELRPDAAADPARLAAAFELRDEVHLRLELEDEFGIRSAEEMAFVFAVWEDREPAVTILDPVRDERVLPSAVLETRVEARDDVGLDAVTIVRQRHRPAGRPGSEPSGPGGAMEPAEGEIEIVRTPGSPTTASLEATATIDVAQIGAQPDDEVWLTGIATDALALAAERAPTRSTTRVLFIVSREQFVEELRESLAEARRAAIRIDTLQEETEELAREGTFSRETRRGQSQVSSRLARQLEALASVERRAERNRLEDPALDDILGEAADALARAGQASAGASGAMDQAADQPDGQPTDAQQDQIERDQRRVRDELRRLIEMLDRGEDAWVIRHQLSEILETEKALKETTERLGRQTAGKDAADLSDAELAQLESVQEQQESLAGRLEELLDEMRAREQALRERDPAGAMGLAQAAQTASSQQTTQRMRDAAESAADNQMSNAASEQEEAIESLEQMIEDLDAGEQKREEALRRLLLSIKDSIEALIAQQTAELDALDARRQTDQDIAGLDRGMIRLNENTLQVIDMARTAGAELAPIASLLESASDAQILAVSTLRSDQPDGEEVLAHEQRSLDFLEQAKQRADEEERRLAQQELEKKKEELRRAYRDVLEKQAALRTRTEPFVILDQLDRRDRIRVRKLAETQDDIRLTLRRILEDNPELSVAGVVIHAHDRLDDLSTAASDRLLGGRPGQALRRQDRIMETLRGLIEALKDPEADESEFSEDPGGGGGGGSGGSGGDDPLVEMLGELILLRSMQSLVAEETSWIDEEGDDEGAALDDLAGEQKELADVGSKLLERMQGGGGGGPAPDDLPDPDDLLPPTEDESDEEDPA